MPMNLDIAPVSSQAALYPNWVLGPVIKPQGGNQLRLYRTSRQEADENFTFEEELDAKSVFDPLFGLGSQSSQPLGSQSSTSLGTTMGAAGPKTPLHFSETSPTIPPFDLALLGLPAPMSPMMVGKNVLLNLVPGSPVKSSAPPGIGHGVRVSGQSSCSDSPMSLGSPAVTSSLTLALKVHQKTAAVMKRTWTPQTTAPGREQTEDPLEDHNVHMASTPYIGTLPGWDCLLEINSVQMASMPLLVHRCIFLGII